MVELPDLETVDMLGTTVENKHVTGDLEADDPSALLRHLHTWSLFHSRYYEYTLISLAILKPTDSNINKFINVWLIHCPARIMGTS